MSRPVVCHVLHGLEVGGVETHAARLARGLRERWRFVFACLDTVGPLGVELAAEGFAVHRLGRRPGVDLRCGRRLAALLSAEKVDLVHGHTWSPFFYAATARAWRPAPTLLYAEHARPHPDRRRRRHVLFNRLALRRADRVVSVSRWTAAQVHRCEGIPAGRIEVVPNGVPPIGIDAGVREAVRRELQISPDTLLVLQVARLDALKDPLAALRALHEVRRRGLDAVLVLAGEGPARDLVERRIWELGLAPHVRLLGLRRDVPRLMAAADVCVLSSRSEAAPLAVLEAMAAGRPVVATAVGGVAEIVEDGRTGILVPPGDIGRLADALFQVVDEPATTARMGREGRRRWMAQHGEPAMLARYESIYEQMVAIPRHRER